MKVVLFCGGLGMRLKEHAENLPKPMVTIGYRPILWHVMKYYAHYGHKEFILCLGHKADVIKNYFLTYNECVSNDFTLSEGGKRLQLLHSDIDDWSITFVDTGLASNIGERLKAVERYLGRDDMFLANYSDGLTDLVLPDLIDFFRAKDAIACLTAVKPPQSFHIVSGTTDGLVTGIKDVRQSDVWINAGYFVFRRDIFDYIGRGEELVGPPFGRLLARRKLVVYKHPGFFACMDTFKEKQMLEDLHARGEVPWEVWRTDEHRDGEDLDEHVDAQNGYDGHVDSPGAVPGSPL